MAVDDVDDAAIDEDWECDITATGFVAAQRQVERHLCHRATLTGYGAKQAGGTMSALPRHQPLMLDSNSARARIYDGPLRRCPEEPSEGPNSSDCCILLCDFET